MLNSCKTGKKRPDDEKIWDETREEEKKPSLIIQNDGEAGETGQFLCREVERATVYVKGL